MTATDEALWARAVLGDGEAFDVIFDRHRSRVRRHAIGLVSVPADADDVLAVVFLEAWRKRDTIRFVDGSMLPWLLRTATYTASNLTRASRRYRDALQRLPAPDPTAAGQSEDAHTDVMIALHAMSLTDRQVITLCVLEQLTAEDAARVLTGGAVSAAALNIPAPVSTVNVEAMARSIVYDDTQLFGTPFILSGQGDTNVILGPAPEGATTIAVALNCVDPASFDVRVDGEHTMTVTCNEELSSRAGGASFIAISTEDDTDHQMSISTGTNQRYAAWASWAAPATPPDSSPAQREALSDRTVTEDEYRDGFARFQQCMVDAGHLLGSVNYSGTIIT